MTTSGFHVFPKQIGSCQHHPPTGARYEVRVAAAPGAFTVAVAAPVRVVAPAADAAFASHAAWAAAQAAGGCAMTLLAAALTKETLADGTVPYTLYASSVLTACSPLTMPYTQLQIAPV